MAFHISDPATDAAVRRLAAIRGKGITETVRDVVEAELRRARAETPLVDRIRPLQDRLADLPDADTRDVRAIRDDLDDGL